MRRSVKGCRVCGDEVWVAPQANARLFGYPYRRNITEWRAYSDLLGSVERMYSVWKGASALEGHCYRGLAKVRARVLLTAMMRQAMGLLGLLGLLGLQRASAWQLPDDGLAMAA